MRRLGWVDISTEEVMHKRIEIRRERIGIENGQQRGVLPVAANVEEAVARLKEVEGRFKDYHGSSNEDKDVNGHEESAKKEEKSSKQNPNSREKILQSLGERKIYMEGRLTHRTEPEVKTHTSYLTFAVLPQQWNEEEEEAARAKWPVKKKEAGMDKPGSNRQQKKAARQNLNRAKGSATAKDSADAPEAQQAAVVGESAETETKEDPMSIDSILS
jgi:tRNA (adenine57-N1/adenine58-N1)-methyltransferase